MMRRGVVAAILVPILLTLAAGAAVAREFEREFTFATDDLKVVNMIGTVQVVEAPGDEFQIQVTVRGEDATEDFLEFAEFNDDGDENVVTYFNTHHNNGMVTIAKKFNLHSNYVSFILDFYLSMKKNFYKY